VDPRTTQNDMENLKFLNLSGLEFPTFLYPARSQPLYPLRYFRSYGIGSKFAETSNKKYYCLLEKKLCILPAIYKHFEDTGFLHRQVSILPYLLQIND
jgi:hypothetical protein